MIIEDPEVRKKLTPASWGQTQIEDASHLLVFCGNTSVTPELIDEFINIKSEVQGIDKSGLKGYGDFILGKMKDLSTEQITN